MKADVTNIMTGGHHCYRHDMISLGKRQVVVCTDYIAAVNNWETMVFHCRKDGEISNAIELDSDWAKEPEEIHEQMVRKWKAKMEKNASDCGF